jgi:RNase P/RNase MRP subunit p30
MEIIRETNFNKARKKIRESKNPIFTSDNDDLNRKVLEKENISILLINQEGRKDFSKQRNSGFNQVLAKIAKKKNTTIGINLDELIYSKNKEKIIARVIQNINICKKNKLKMKFISEKNSKSNYDLKALGLVLGMPTTMTKQL